MNKNLVLVLRGVDLLFGFQVFKFVATSIHEVLFNNRLLPPAAYFKQSDVEAQQQQLQQPVALPGWSLLDLERVPNPAVRPGLLDYLAVNKSNT